MINRNVVSCREGVRHHASFCVLSLMAMQENTEGEILFYNFSFLFTKEFVDTEAAHRIKGKKNEKCIVLK